MRTPRLVVPDSRFRRGLAISVLFGAVASILAIREAHAAERRPFAPEDYYALKEAGTPQFSPGGSDIVFTVTSHVRAINKDMGSIWLVPADGSGEARQLTDSTLSATHPSWSPDGRTVAFVATVGGGGPPQVQLLSLADGRVRQLTNLKNGVRDYRWSPDGARLVCVSGSSSEDEEGGSKPSAPDASDTRRYVHALYKRDGEGFLDDRRLHLWVIDVGSGTAAQITRGADWDDTQPEWSPDGRHIAFASDRSGQAFDTARHSDIWVVSRDGRDLKRISSRESAHPPYAAHAPHWLPDGRQVAFQADEGEGGPVAIWIARQDGRKPAEDIFKDDYLFTEYGNDVFWRANGLYYVGNYHGTQQVFRADIAPGKVTKVTDGDRFVSDLDVAQNRHQIVYASNDFTHPNELYVADPDTGAERQLTHLNRDLLDKLELATLARIAPFKSADGLPIDGFIAKPVGWKPGRRYPMVLLIHGGPTNMFGFGWTQYMQALTAQGYAVFYTNPRGSSGYGWDFISADRNEWGGKGYTDIMTGVDAVLAQNPWIDRSRLGISGASYGGYMTNWIISHTTRFAAAIPIASMSNLVSIQGTRDEPYGHARFFGGDLFQNYDLYWQYSPLRYAQSVRTPTLILHGDADNRVPLEQPEQWFRALRHFNVPAEFVIFPREHHTSYATGEPKHVVEAMHWMAYWFDRYLKRNSAFSPPDAP